MSKNIQAIRGMNDILPEESIKWQNLEEIIKQIANQFGFKQIRTPVVEATELFKRSIGDITDIVEKEMYSFNDRNGDSITLRPEGTASCVRAVMQHSLLNNGLQKLYYFGQMFRYERPQKGRYRQFHQFGIEVFNAKDADIDAEVINLSYQLWKRLGINDIVQLEINSIGSVQERNKYSKALFDYFSQHIELLDEDSKNRLHRSPLRILDSKNENMQEIITKAPKIEDFLEEESRNDFANLQTYLKALKIPFIINNKLVRGLDYYNKTVFEWTTDKLGAQSTICAGGRYDGLVEQLGGKQTFAFGFALGFERLLLLLETMQLQQIEHKKPFIYVCALDEASQAYSLNLAQILRDEFKNETILNNLGLGKLKNQLKKADNLGAKFALIVGENELKTNKILLKDLTNNTQTEIAILEIATHLKNLGA